MFPYRPNMVARVGRGHSGFTLLEVLVAFTIFALTAGAMMSAISTGLKSSRIASQQAIAALIAESKLAAAGIEHSVQEAGAAGTAQEDYRWRVSVTPLPSEGTAAESAGFLPMRIDVTVSWGNLPDERSVTLSAVRLAEVR